ncbi:MAG: type III-B CRISPR module RAMP protein Cmr4 [Bacteroidota bacterium]
MSAANLYTIHCRSNLHAGAGDQSFGIIDKHVQRDPTTRLPTIFSSSLKGSLREKASAVFTAQAPGKEDPRIVEIFGSDNAKGAAKSLRQGAVYLSDAYLLGLPIRSTDQLFYVATCPELLADFLATAAKAVAAENLTQLQKFMDQLKGNFPEEGKPLANYPAQLSKVYLEDLAAARLELDAAALSPLLGPRVALLHVNDFARLAEDLPTVARNRLDNGISENLWYEEIVARETRFYCTVGEAPGGLPNSTALQQLDTLIKANSSRVQIGANATIGYGQTVWTKLQQDD